MCQELALDARQRRSERVASPGSRWRAFAAGALIYPGSAVDGCVAVGHAQFAGIARGAAPVSVEEDVSFGVAFQGSQGGVKVGYICVPVP